jgi:hypothetical protein
LGGELFLIPYDGNSIGDYEQDTVNVGGSFCLPPLKINSSLNNSLIVGQSGDFIISMINQNYNPIEIYTAQGAVQLTKAALVPARQGSVNKPPSVSCCFLITY